MQEMHTDIFSDNASVAVHLKKMHIDQPGPDDVYSASWRRSTMQGGNASGVRLPNVETERRRDVGLGDCSLGSSLGPLGLKQGVDLHRALTRLRQLETSTHMGATDLAELAWPSPGSGATSRACCKIDSVRYYERALRMKSPVNKVVNWTDYLCRSSVVGPMAEISPSLWLAEDEFRR